jgi:chromosome segregation ATPase
MENSFISQAEKAHAQEQLEAEHQKRRDEFHAAQAQLDSFSEGVRQLSETVLQQASELRTTRLAFLHVARHYEGEAADGLDSGGESGGELEMLDSEVQGTVNCGKDKKGVLDSCQGAMARFEREVKEQLRAMETAAETGRQLEEKGADLARVTRERDAAEKLAGRLEKELEKIRVEKEGAEDVARRLEANLEKMRVEKQGAEDVARRLQGGLEKARVEKEGASGREGALRAQVTDLERRRREQMKKVSVFTPKGVSGRQALDEG